MIEHSPKILASEEKSTNQRVGGTRFPVIAVAVTSCIKALIMVSVDLKPHFSLVDVKPHVSLVDVKPHVSLVDVKPHVSCLRV